MRRKNVCKNRFFHTFVIMTVFLWALSVPVVLLFPVLPVLIAQAQSISGVMAADIDTTGYGLDGRDFSVTWTVGTEPSGYVGTKIFILPNATTVAANTILVNACGGSPCVERGFTSQFQQNGYTLPQMVSADSAGTTWNAATEYKACVLIDATTDELVCSSAFTVTSDDAVSDTNAPMIDHVPVHAVAGGADAKIYAMIIDDQTSSADFANTGDGGVEYIKMYYGLDVSSSEASMDASLVEGNLFVFTIPSLGLPPEGTAVEYYLVARDNTAGTPGNVSYFCANPSATSAADCQSSPLVATVAAAGVRSVSGTIRYNTSSGAQALEGAKVFAAGYATPMATTDVNGVYTISNLPNNDSFDFTAYKQGYCDNRRFETIGTANLTGIDINLNIGECGFYGGDGGGGDSTPYVMFSGPPEGSNYVPLNENIRVGFNVPLNAATVNDLDASDSGSNVYLTTDGTIVGAVAGSVLWCANQSSAGCSSIPSMDTNTILFSPVADLTASTFYTLVITEAVTSEAGQAISGNRPGGGHRISFTTSGTSYDAGAVATNFGQGGQYLPPYVRSTVPAPGMSVRPNTKILIEFDQTMSGGTLSTDSIKLAKMINGTPNYQTVTVSLGSNENRFVTVTPSASLSEGEYEIQVLGSAANAQGMPMRPPDQASSVAFRNNFWVSGTDDITGPTVYPMLANNSTAVAVNIGSFQFGFNEPLNFNTVTPSNITLSRGATSVSITALYDPGGNNIYVIPDNVLAPNTTYTVNIGTGVTDLAGNALASAAVYTYTTGNADTAAPNLKEARCDDYSCYIAFTEPMNNDIQGDANYDNSVLKTANWTIERTAPDVAPIDLTGKPINYDAKNYAVTIEGVAGLAASNSFRVTAGTSLKDLSGNAINTASSANVFNGTVENSMATFGSFGDFSMFGPPVAGVGGMDTASGTFTGTIGGEFKAEGFGSFTASQFAFGQADMAYPFNPMASQDSNVFQVRFNPGVVLQNGDLVVLTFPVGTTLTNTVPDTYSPFYADFNESMGAGTVTFGTLDTDGVSVDTVARTVTVQLAVSSGTPGASDAYTIDLRKIVNPAIPKGPEAGGYTVGIKVKRGGETIVNKTSMPYFIMAGGTRSITVKVYAGTAVTGTAGANGDIHMWGGGPGGPMDKLVTLTDGITTAADGTAIAGDAGIVYSNLPDGCYHFGTEPFVTLGGADYFGQMSPEPVCVNSTTPNATKNLVLAAASGAGTMNVTVKLAGIADFGGADIDVFAGGPGRFVVKTLSGVGAPNAGGYTITLNANGPWNVGVGPAMPKGVSMSMPKALPGIAPPPTDIIVSGLPGTGTIAQGFKTPPSVSVNTSTKTITFTFAAADKTVSGTVTDGTNGLANVNVFMHSLGFGQPAFTTTKSDGTFSLSVSDYGTYEIGVAKGGLPPAMNNIEIRPDGADAGTDPDIFYKGKQITGGNPLVIKLKKGAYTISGKVLDSNSNGIAYAPIFATDADGNSANGGTSSDGSYSIFVDAGTWTVKSMMPPDKTDTCGTLSKTVIISTESKANQNISPSAGTCYTVSGTVTVAGSPLTNAPIFVDEWDTTNNRPVAGGMFKPANTNSSGVYTVKVKGNTTYHIGTWDPTYGEISITQAVTTSNLADADINSGTTGTVTLSFTGGSASHEAFIELKKSDDKFTRVGKTQKGLASDVTFTMKEGTYNYFVDVFGVGKYSGSVATGASATIDLSDVSLVTLSGNVKDADDTNISGALVTVKSSDGTVKTATTDSSGNYSLSVKEGTYTVSASKAQYIAGEAAASVSLTTDEPNYDFGGASPDQTALNKSDQVISGIIYQSDGTTPATSGFVTATEATSGVSVTAAVDHVTGTYSLPVDDGVWTVKAAAPLHAKTTLVGAVTTSGATDETDQDITLTADATKASTSTSASLSSTTGGSVNDTQNTGIKLTAGQGVLETGNVTVSVNMEKTFTAPDTDTFRPLADAAFTISAQNAESTSSIKDLKGNAEIQIDYTELLSSLPSGVSESDLKLTYYSPEKDAYIPVEGGFTVDAANNTITGQVDHFTDFAIVYVPAAATAGTVSSPYNLSLSISNDAAQTASLEVTLNISALSATEMLIANSSDGLSSATWEPYSTTKSWTLAEGDYGTRSVYVKFRSAVGNISNAVSDSIEYAATVTEPPASSPGGGTGTTPTTPAPTATEVPEAVEEATPTVVEKVSEAAQAFAQKVVTILGEAAEVVKANVETLLTKVGLKRDLAKEQKTSSNYVKMLVQGVENLTAENTHAINNFIAYGTETTKILGEGERAGVLNSYKAAFGKLPTIGDEWADAIKIANGRWPNERSESKEAAATEEFKKIYLRAPDRSNSHDDAAVTVMAYGLRPSDRNLDSEKAAIKIFRGIYRYAPKTAVDWDIVRAIAYSGAQR